MCTSQDRATINLGLYSLRWVYLPSPNIAVYPNIPAERVYTNHHGPSHVENLSVIRPVSPIPARHGEIPRESTRRPCLLFSTITTRPLITSNRCVSKTTRPELRSVELLFGLPDTQAIP